MDKKLQSGKTGFLLIALLFSLAVAQPLYDLLGEHAEFFVTHGMGRNSLLGFTIVFSLLLPVAFAVLPAFAGRFLPWLGRLCFYLLQFLLWVLIFLPIASRAGLEGVITIAVCSIAATIGIAAYAKMYPVRLMFYYLAPAILVFPLFFLFSSKATEIVLPEPLEAVSTHSSPATDKNVVFVVLDEFPLTSLLTADLEIDRHRFPNFGRLADMSAWFRGATTPSELTTGAVPVALSGLDIDEVQGLLPLHSNFPRTLFTLLGSSHEVTAFETSTLLCPQSVCRNKTNTGSPLQRLNAFSNDLKIIYAHLVVPRPWSAKLPSISHAWSGFANETTKPGISQPADPAMESAEAYARIRKQENWRDRAEEFQQFIDTIKKSRQPGVYYLHSLLPHSAWRYLPDGKQYVFNEDRVNFGIRPDDDPQRVYFHEWYGDTHAVNQSWQRHILQVQFVDRLIGRLLDKLQEENLLDDSLIVVVGDHGASFIPGQSRRDANEKTLSDITAVPLFIKLPGQEVGSIEDFPTSLTGIFPTIVEAMQLETDWQFSGSDLMAGPRQDDTDTVRILKSGGEPFSYDFSRHQESLRTRAIQLHGTFGSGEDSRLFNYGPYPSLTGKKLETLTIGTPSQGQLMLEGSELFDNVDIRAAFVPRQPWGRWAGMDRGQVPKSLAIAINGVVKVTTQTYSIPGFHDYFSGMLPADALSPGANRVQVFSIDDDQGQPVLREIFPSESAPARLLSSDQGDLLLRSDDVRISLKKDPWPGAVETVLDQDKALVHLQGNVHIAAGENLLLMVFRNGMSTHSKSISAAGVDSPGELHFRIPIDYTGEHSTAATRLRVLVIDEGNGLAKELEYPSDCSSQWVFAPPPSWTLKDCNSLPASLPSLAEGAYRAVLNFARESIRQYMGEGWSVHKSKLSWTVGNHAQLALPLPEFSGPWKFQATMKPFLAPDQLEKQRLILSVKGEKIREWEFTDSDFTTVEWQITGHRAIDESSLVLDFTIPDAESPQSLGVSTDPRPLGFAFTRLVITGQPENEAE